MTYLQPRNVTLTDEEFQTASVSDRQIYLMSPRVSPTRAEELLSTCREKDCIDVVNEKVADKISQNCNDECARARNIFIMRANELNNSVTQMSDNAINKADQTIDYLKKTSKSFEELGQFVQSWREQVADPDDITKKLTDKIQNNYLAGRIGKDVRDDMIKKVKDSLSFDPLYTTSLKEVIDNTNTGLRHAINRKDAEKKGWQKVKAGVENYTGSITRGVKGMTKTDLITKGSEGLGHVLTAVTKFKTGHRPQIVGQGNTL